MSSSDALRIQDVRDAHRLIGECRELGADPALWDRHMLHGLSRLLGVMQATGGEGWWRRPAGIQAVSGHQVTADPAADTYFLAYLRASETASDPIFAVLATLPGSQITRTRRQLVPDSVWYRSAAFDQYRRRAQIDHDLTSICRVSDDGAISCISLHRARGDRAFSEREQRLVEFLHAELGRLIGGPLISDIEPGPERLSPRLRQTLGCLLEGDGERQVAARLGLAHPTVHQYVLGLYRHFRVRSRFELLAHARKRVRREAWRGVLPGGEPRASAPDGDLEGLSPRLHQTLACLLEGESEKQVAARLGLATPTVHHHVMALYRRFGVRSRAQLLAHAMRREGWRGLARPS
jgi:DNA-binding CsgD family transcriptional regulator